MREERGVAMMTVVIMSAVLMVIAAGMYFVASREERMSQADNTGGQAFYYAEGGIETVLDMLNYAATENQLTQPRVDQSPNGYGYLMDPEPANRQNPTDPVQMQIGNETFTVSVDEVDSNGDHCTGCGLNLTSANPAYLLITAEGNSGSGYRKLQQRVRVSASGYPLTFYIDGDVNANGNVALTNQSIFVRGNFYGREKLNLSGSDLWYGGGAGVFATGSIYAKANGGNSQIYSSSGSTTGYWSSNMQYDRDSRGPAGNTFSLSELQATFGTTGLSSSQLAQLKSQAQASGYYNGDASGSLTLQQGDIPSHDGDIVVFIEFPTGSPSSNDVKLKFEWPHSPYSNGKALIVVRNGKVSLEGNAIGSLRGIIYCPDGSVTANGSGNGTFTGYVWGKGFIDIGNFNFLMTSEFINDPPFFAWNVTRETAWTEVDR
jgi:hypothetical protein